MARISASVLCCGLCACGGASGDGQTAIGGDTDATSAAPLTGDTGSDTTSPHPTTSTTDAPSLTTAEPLTTTGDPTDDPGPIVYPEKRVGMFYLDGPCPGGTVGEAVLGHVR